MALLLKRVVCEYVLFVYMQICGDRKHLRAIGMSVQCTMFYLQELQGRAVDVANTGELGYQVSGLRSWAR